MPFCRRAARTTAATPARAAAGRRRQLPSPHRLVLALGAALVVAGGVATAGAATGAVRGPGTSDASSSALTVVLDDATGSGGFQARIAGLAPMDVVNRYVDVTVDGATGEDLLLGAQDATPSALSTDTARGLQVTVLACTTAWDVSSATCPGATTTLLPATPLAALTTDAVPLGAAAADLHLQVSTSLPDVTETTVNGVAPTDGLQSLSAALTYTVTAA